MARKLSSASRRRLLQHTSLLLGGMAASAWLPGHRAAFAAEAPTARIKKGGVLVLVDNPEPATLASYISTSGPIHPVTTKIYEGLLEYDFDLTPRPGLAESWSLSDDKKSVTFNLRKGVLWHDGAPFTSADVKFSIMNVLKVMHPRGMIIFAPVVDVETPDEHTVILRMSEPNPAMMMGLSLRESPMVPKHILEQGDIRQNANANEPIGTGPFVFKSWKRGNYILLERNPKYWQASRPHLDKVVFRFLPDASARAAALRQDEIQVAAYNSVQLSDVKRLTEGTDLAFTTRGYEMISPMALMEMNTRIAPFDNLLVRQAVAHAIDRKFIIDNIWFGFGKPATGPISSNFSKIGLYEPDVMAYDFNVDKANELLDQAGHKRNAAGVRFEIWHDILPYGLEWKMLGEYFLQALAKVGITVKIRYEDVARFMRRVYTENDFHINSVWLSNQADPVLGVARTYTTAGIQKGVALSNGSGYSNAEVDRLFMQARSEPDGKARAEQYRAAQRQIVKDCPCIWVSEMQFVTLYNKRVNNLVQNPLGVDSGLADAWMGEKA